MSELKKEKSEFMQCGKIVATHGIKGEVKIYPWCDSPETITKLSEIFVDEGDMPLGLLSARVHGSMVLALFKGVDSPEIARTLVGKIVYLRRDDIILSEGSFFIQDLIGLNVVDADTGEKFGKLSNVFETGANDVYEISAPNGKKLLFPAIKQVIINTDLKTGEMRIRPMKGLFDE